MTRYSICDYHRLKASCAAFLSRESRSKSLVELYPLLDELGRVETFSELVGSRVFALAFGRVVEFGKDYVTID